MGEARKGSSTEGMGGDKGEEDKVHEAEGEDEKDHHDIPWTEIAILHMEPGLPPFPPDSIYGRGGGGGEGRW